MRTIALTAVLCLGIVFPGFAQQLTGDRSCATNTYAEALKAQHPSLEQKQQQVQQAVQETLQQKRQWQNLRTVTTITIPVVFHVLYDKEEENVSGEQILSQLAVLNADFRRRNADAVNTPSYFAPYAADTRIEFCLATIDPNGDPTTGITRTQTYRTEFNYITDYIKKSANGGTDAWDTNRYLNIWIGDIKDNVLGYASMPGATLPHLDGVVLHYAAVGAAPANKFDSPYNLGRTATHEVGHWLGLSHIWGEDDASCSDSDGIDDTPNQESYTTDCTGAIEVSCGNGPYGNMYQNYMDYSNDACMNLFTHGQAAYMNAVISTSRSQLLYSLACTNSIRSDFGLAQESDTLVVAGSSIQFAATPEGVRATEWLWEFKGGIPATSTQQNPTVTYPQPGQYDVKLTVSNGTVTDSEVKEDFVHVTVSDLTVYPNPTSDYLYIEQPARILVRHVELINSVGKTILTAEARSRTLQLDVRHLPPGVYFMRLVSTNGTEIRRVSVVR
ncbi:M43 family zinc metalloprotease [Pontibacter anaerobius]|uniref:M43 family zinc metalloprotease n=1 Tax=Pontibacter anaerobius TaxID=2993940 RepID=A0ABT3RGR0_9BACT|nr:M43 family zinc metalloprotease [Pontibacter anaerobius]MCX2740631.1 M43 family zinc metalloprotease [Pontibacter anaerobius]